MKLGLQSQAFCLENGRNTPKGKVINSNDMTSLDTEIGYVTSPGNYLGGGGRHPVKREWDETRQLKFKAFFFRTEVLQICIRNIADEVW